MLFRQVKLKYFSYFLFWFTLLLNLDFVFAAFKLFEKKSFTYSYLLADPETRCAVLIDPVIDTVERDLKLVEQLKLKLLYLSNLIYF